MTATYSAKGDTIDYTQTASVAAGDVIAIGTLFQVANRDIAEGETAGVSISGIYEIAKQASTAITAGAAVYWDAGSNVVTTTQASNTKIGIAVYAATSEAATAFVLINA